MKPPAGASLPRLGPPALDRADGRELWRWQSGGTKGGIRQEPVVAGRLLLATDGYENTFYACR
jgi:hypothetical protein